MSELLSYEGPWPTGIGGDASGTKIGDALFEDYAEAQQAPNPGMGVWFYRCAHSANRMPVDVAIQKHRREWRQALGLPPSAQPPIQDGEAPIVGRYYRGSGCGLVVPGIEPVGSGAVNPELVLTWLYHLYSSTGRQMIREKMREAGHTDVLMSWPDARQAGRSANDFAALLMELVSDGFAPLVMLLSKDMDPWTKGAGAGADLAFDECVRGVQEILPWLTTPRRCSRVGIAWEMSIWHTPQHAQRLIDTLAPLFLPFGIRTYVHFQGGYAKFPEDRTPEVTMAEYWFRQVGKLHGVLYQRDPARDGGSKEVFKSVLADTTTRFAGNFLCPTDNGINGEPFSVVAFETTYDEVFHGRMTPEEGNAWGRASLEVSSTGPAGTVRVDGSGNGQ